MRFSLDYSIYGMVLCAALMACTAPQKKYDLYAIQPSRDNDATYVTPHGSFCNSLNDAPTCGGI